MIRDLMARAEKLRPAAIQRLEQLVMLESPSGHAELISALNGELAAVFAGVGARVERDPGPDGDHLVCRWSAAANAEPAGHVLLIGHSDTVFAAGSTAGRPFRLLADADTVTGPGVYDMKGALVEVELALRLLADCTVPLRRPVRLVIVNDEEIGSPDGHRVVQAHADGAVAAIGLEPPLPGGGLKIGRRGVARVELAVDGVEAHAGLDADLGISAIDELLDQLTSLRTTFEGTPEMAVNIGTIAGGTRANVIAGHASAELGLRFSTPQAERAVLGTLESLSPIRAGAAVRTDRLSYRPAWAADTANPVAAALVQIAARAGLDLAVGVSAGAGDTNVTGASGLPTVDGLGPEGSGAHAASEQASLTSLVQRAALLAAYLGDEGSL